MARDRHADLMTPYGQSWNLFETALLVLFAHNGFSYSDAAAGLCRTRNAISGKARKLGVRFRGAGGKKFARRKF